MKSLLKGIGNEMKGKVEFYDIKNDKGLIVSNDGSQYHFCLSNWNLGGFPEEGMEVFVNIIGTEEFSLVKLIENQ